jgi:hypothetical protein
VSRAIASGHLVRLRRGQLIRRPAGGDSPLHTTASQRDLDSFAARDREMIAQAIAASRACRGSVISHRSAALIHGFAVLADPHCVPTLTVAPRGAGNLAGAHLHRATIDEGDVTSSGDVRMTTAARTVVDLARAASTAAAVVCLDSALHQRALVPEEIDQVLLRCWNWPGIKRASRAVDLCDPRSESPLESVSRLVLRWLGLPAPALQSEIHDAKGRFIGRLDFYWNEFGVAGEADGAGKYELGPTTLLEEKRRQERLENLGLIVVRWGWADLTTRPSELRDRLRDAFSRGSLSDRSPLCRAWSVAGGTTGHARHKGDRRFGTIGS